MKSYFQNEKGGMLVYTLLVFLIFTILGVSLMAYTYSDVKLSQVDRKQQGAFYIAEAGANQAFYEIKEKLNSGYTIDEIIIAWDDQDPIKDFEEQFGEQPSAEVEVKPENHENKEYIIKSTGKIGEQERVVIKPFTVQYSGGGTSFPELPERVAGIFRDKAKLVGSASIDGHMYLLSDAPSTIELKGGGGKRISEKIYVPESAIYRAINPNITHGIQTEIASLPEEHNLDWFDQQLASIINDFKEPTKPNSYPEDKVVIAENGNTHEVIDNGNLKITSDIVKNFTWKVTENTLLKNIIVNSGWTLNIDTNGQKSVDIFVEKLNIAQGHVNIVGEKVNIYVSESIVFSGSPTINAGGEVGQLNIYYTGDSDNTLTLSGEQVLKGNIFVEKAPIHYTASGNFEGSIISGGKEVTLDGANFTKALVMAPLADIDLKGSAIVNGVVIGKSLSAEGNGKINHEKIETSPLFESEEGSGGMDVLPEPTIEIK